ncbi:Uncharacterised protein [Moraxella bovis]|uniref:DUF4276 family protein n=1 Tax=Moraxella bovis TaxID=476 RepID=A0A378PQ49_MORBO|nr:Uncharacterised protein [Moraxella bovis]
MVKVGFIVEGATEKIIIESDKFKTFLKKNDYELINPVIDAKGGGNLLPENIEPFIKTLQAQQADIIAVLTDLEDEDSVDVVKKRIEHSGIEVIFVAVKAIEAWFLADTEAMKLFLKDDFIEEYPEKTSDKPFERIKEIIKERNARGVGSKTILAKNMIKHYRFSIENSANHKNCPSAKEFVDYFKN